MIGTINDSTDSMIRVFKKHYELETQEQEKKELTVLPLFSAQAATLPPLFTFIFVLDESGSMRGQWNNVVLAYTRFIEMRKHEQTGGEEFVSVIQFSSTAREIFRDHPIRTVPSALAFNGGGTEFDPALNMAQQMCASAKGTPVIIFMSDGDGTYSGVMNHIYNQCSARNLQVHTIAFGGDAGVAKLKTIANEGKGQCHIAIDGIQLVNTFADIASTASPVQHLATMVGSRLSALVANKIVVDYL